MTTPVASSISSTTITAAIFRCTRALERRGAAFRIAAGLVLAFALNGLLRADQTASLAWNPVTTTPVAGYAFYMGNVSGVYTSRIDVGTNTQITLTGLKEGQTNYFAVTSYNSARIESPASPAVSYLVPGLLRMAPPSSPTNAPVMSFPVAVGHSYLLQASVNLTTWTNLLQTQTWNTNAWAYYSDPQSRSFTKRFYRLIMQ